MKYAFNISYLLRTDILKTSRSELILINKHFLQNVFVEVIIRTCEWCFIPFHFQKRYHRNVSLQVSFPAKVIIDTFGRSKSCLTLKESMANLFHLSVSLPMTRRFGFFFLRSLKVRERTCKKLVSQSSFSQFHNLTFTRLQQ